MFTQYCFVFSQFIGVQSDAFIGAPGTQRKIYNTAPHLPFSIYNTGVLLCGRVACNPGRHHGQSATCPSAPPLAMPRIKIALYAVSYWSPALNFRHTDITLSNNYMPTQVNKQITKCINGMCLTCIFFAMQVEGWHAYLKCHIYL